MQTYRLTLRPLSALGTPLAGDTLLGQLCWTLHHQLGNQALTDMLQGYIPLSVLREKLSNWQQLAVADAELGRAVERAQPHNTINRHTGTTGTGMFAPYTMGQTWLAPGCLLDVVVVLDEQRLSLEQLLAAFTYMGQHGYGRDASIGLGKFELVGDAAAVTWPQPAQGAPNAWLTLGACAPQGLGFCPVRSHWHSVTRFGRHGDVAVQSGQPFKRPLLLAKAASVFWPEELDPTRAFIGQGLGGASAPVSLSMPQTIHQGYAPVVPLHLPASTMPPGAGEHA